MLSADLKLNGKQILSIDDPAIEWFEPEIQLKINRILQGQDVESIELNGLDATSAVAQEFIDFLMRQKFMENCLLKLKM